MRIEQNQYTIFNSHEKYDNFLTPGNASRNRNLVPSRTAPALKILKDLDAETEDKQNDNDDGQKVK